ncbi:MAG: Arc family DNA-binding protein [Pseudomonadota bacterium]
MAREDLHFRLRIPKDLKEHIEEVARLNKRSMTAEIIDRLENSFRPMEHYDASHIDVDELVTKLHRVIEHAREHPEKNIRSTLNKPLIRKPVAPREKPKPDEGE